MKLFGVPESQWLNFLGRDRTVSPNISKIYSNILSYSNIQNVLFSKMCLRVLFFRVGIFISLIISDYLF